VLKQQCATFERHRSGSQSLPGNAQWQDHHLPRSRCEGNG